MHVEGMPDGQGGVIFITPASATPDVGTVMLISVSIDGGARSDAGAAQFAYTPAPPPLSPEASNAAGEARAPLVESILPSKGVVTGGERVVVRGRGLKGLRAVVRLEGGDGRHVIVEGVCDGGTLQSA